MRNIIKTASQRSLEENPRHILEDSFLLIYPFIELAQENPNSKELFRSAARKPSAQQMLRLISRYFKAEINLGRIRKVSTISISRAIWGGCIDYLHWRHMASDKLKKEVFVKSLVDVLIHGVAKSNRGR
jgi:hypothetical protein